MIEIPIVDLEAPVADAEPVAGSFKTDKVRREFDLRNEAAHCVRVACITQDLAGKNPTEIERVLAGAAAHDITINEKLGALELKLLSRVELLLNATKLEISTKLVSVLSEVSALRRGGTRRVEETLRTLSQLQTQERIARRSGHLRAA